MGEETEKKAEGYGSGSEKWVEDLQRTVIQSKDSAMRSARSFQRSSSSHLRSLQVPTSSLHFQLLGIALLID